MRVHLDIFQYGDYRRYLNAWFEAAQQDNPNVSHRWFARRLGTENPAALAHILSGRRHLTDDRVEDYIRILDLGPDEASYFRALVEFGSAENADQRNRAFGRLAEIRLRVQSIRLSSDEFEFYTHWSYAMVHELARWPDFQADAAWIAERAFPPITVEQAQKALDVNTTLGFIAFRNGKWEALFPTRGTSELVRHLATWPAHRDGLDLAAAGLQRLFSDPGFANESAFFGAQFAIPASHLGEIRKVLYETLFRFANDSDKLVAQADRVVYVNIGVIPVARTPDLHLDPPSEPPSDAPASDAGAPSYPPDDAPAPEPADAAKPRPA